jgi:hypothetical protein
MYRSRIANLALAIIAVTAAAVALTSSGRSAGADQVVPAGLVNAGPSRVLDTRSTGKPLGGQTLTVNTGIAGASSVAVNITLTGTEGVGFITVWASGGRPNTSIINSDRAGQDIANYAVVPVTSFGTFQLYTSAATHVLVDVMGYYTTANVPPPTDTGASAVITGYGPSYSITSISGTVTNGSPVEKSLRVDVRCATGAVETDSVFGIPAGQTRGFQVLCSDGAYTTGASIQGIVEI